VHFPIALLIAGAAAELAGRLRPRTREALTAVASWSLWLGAAAALIAAGLGYLAEQTAPHVPDAWQVMARHELLGYWTAGVFAALALWRWRWPRTARAAFLPLWLLALALLLMTAQKGGQLVFSYGMGVTAP
jgi:uncharacterized membrane protein